PLIPLLAMITGILIVKVSRDKMAIWIPLLLIFSFTRLAQPAPWIFANPSGAMAIGKFAVQAHVPTKMSDRFLDTGSLLFLRDLWQENPGTVAKTCAFLRTYSSRADVLITNYCWDALYFQTRLPQALKILPDYP